MNQNWNRNPPRTITVPRPEKVVPFEYASRNHCTALPPVPAGYSVEKTEPPSTISVWPLMKALSSDARKTTVPSTSSG